MDDSLLSPGAELVLKANRQPLTQRINLETSFLDSLQSADVFTHEENNLIQVSLKCRPIRNYLVLLFQYRPS